MFLSDMAGRTPLYKKYVKDLLRNTLHEGLNLQNSKHITASDICFLLSGMWKRAFVYFSSPISRELVAQIKKDSTVLPRIGALSEVRLFFFFRLPVCLEQAALCELVTLIVELLFSADHFLVGICR